MKISVRTRDQIATQSVRALGLDDETHLIGCPEAFAQSLRRAASFLCPATPRSIIDAVLETLRPLMTHPPTRETLSALLNQLISTGDLLEVVDDSDGRDRRLLYLGPPTFVERSAGQYLLAGIRPLGHPLVDDAARIEHEGHLRTASFSGGNADDRLQAAGLHGVTRARWVGLPGPMTPADYISHWRTALASGLRAGRVEDLRILDPGADVSFYSGRWRPPTAADRGDFVGRRPQAYGADLWCLVRLRDGVPTRLHDYLPTADGAPARDDAWRYQAAVDASADHSQSARFHAGLEHQTVDFFAPVPTWAERYLSLIGVPVQRSRGALFSYRVPTVAVPELKSVLADTLWMTAIEPEEKM